jgi:ABC-type branched-subunit amino acid transport system substrate-binding protein
VRKTTFAGVITVSLALLAGAVALAGTTHTVDDPGVTPTSILLGGTTPLTGPAAAYASVARGANAYFQYVNAHGGVLGRKITYKYLDDGYNPANTVQQTRQLVEQDHVFAIFNSLGTEQNLAIRDYLNAMKVPQLFAATGDTSFGSDVAKYPYTIAFQPSYQAEGFLLGKYVARSRPNARIAVLAQNDSYGRDLLFGLKRGLGGGKAKVVAAQNYEVTASDVGSQVARLKSSGADTLAIFATPQFAIQAYVYAEKLNWKPLVLNNAVSSATNIMVLASEGGKNPVVNGTVSVIFLKDPTDQKWKNDAAIKLYRRIMSTYAKGANVDDVYHVYGMAAAYTLVDALKKAGRNLTRDGIVKAVSNLDITTNPFLLPGIVVKTGPRDHFPLNQVYLQRWSKTGWKQFGSLLTYKGQ